MWRIGQASKSNSMDCLIPHGIVPLTWSNTLRNVVDNMISTHDAVQPLVAHHKDVFWNSVKSMHWLWLWTRKNHWQPKRTDYMKDIHMPITNHAMTLRYFLFYSIFISFELHFICILIFDFTMTFSDCSLFGRRIHWRSSDNHPKIIRIYKRFETINWRISRLIALIVHVRWILAKAING